MDWCDPSVVHVQFSVTLNETLTNEIATRTLTTDWCVVSKLRYAPVLARLTGHESRFAIELALDPRFSLPPFHVP